MAPVGAAKEDRQLVPDEFGAERLRPAARTRSDAAAVWGDGAEDCRFSGHGVD